MQKAAPEQVIPILQEHLQKHSRLENHSFDTYLLEVIAEHKELIDMPRGINLRNKKEREELRAIVIQQQVKDELVLTLV